MTIVIGIAAPDGIILAADSRTTTMIPSGTDGLRYRIASDTAEKVFEVCGKYAVATFGDAFIGEQTIAGVMAEFEALIDADENTVSGVEQFADRLGSYFQERYLEAREAAERPVTPEEEGALGFQVAGYDAAGVGHVYTVLVPRGGRIAGAELLTTSMGIQPRGQTEVINRLLRGVDWGAINALGIQIDPQLNSQLDLLTYRINYPITLQDAVDLAMFLIRTTIDMQRFSDGIAGSADGSFPTCGGGINVLAVQPAGVHWVSRADLEIRQRGGDAEGAI